jgi:dTDP-glucose 4,6-dehydratase
MRILLTGAAGFIGSHLCDRLLADGHDVIGLDNFVTGSRENLAHLESHPRFRLLEHDVSKFINPPETVDAVMHFASPASPNPDSPYGYPQLPIQTLKAGALGTHNSLGVAKACGARFLLASTSEIYGDPLEHPQRESYFGHVDPIGPRSCYDEAKRFAEAMTMAYCRYHGLDTKIVRIFNTYGPRMRLDDGRVVPNFVSQAFRGEPLTVYGDGKQTRSFCYIDDLVEGICRLLLSDGHDPSPTGAVPAIRSADNRISPVPRNCSAGNPRYPLRRVCAARSNTLNGESRKRNHKSRRYAILLDAERITIPPSRKRGLLGTDNGR